MSARSTAQVLRHQACWSNCLLPHGLTADAFVPCLPRAHRCGADDTRTSTISQLLVAGSTVRTTDFLRLRHGRPYHCLFPTPSPELRTQQKEACVLSLTACFLCGFQGIAVYYSVTPGNHSSSTVSDAVGSSSTLCPGCLWPFAFRPQMHSRRRRGTSSSRREGPSRSPG